MGRGTVRRTVEGFAPRAIVAFGAIPSTTAFGGGPPPHLVGRSFHFRLGATNRIASPPPGASAIVIVSPFFTGRCSIVIEWRASVR